MSEHEHIFTFARSLTLVGSILVALGSGTNYVSDVRISHRACDNNCAQVYSAYAPQLGAKLHLSHTQLNIIGISGNCKWSERSNRASLK